MRALLTTGTFLALLTLSIQADEARLKTECHGTAVEFVDTPKEAAKLAAQQKKLVLVLHVSGHFEDPDFT